MKLWMKGEVSYFSFGRTQAIDDHWLEWASDGDLAECVAWWTQGLEEVDTKYLFEEEER